MVDDAPTLRLGRPSADVFLLGGAPRSVLVIVTVAVVALCAGFAQGALVLQHHFAASGGGRLAHLLAAGSTVGTVWMGWGASIFFAIAVLRLRHEPPEPPAGLTPLESMSLPEIHRGLRREYTVVRVALDAVTVVALLDLARTVRSALAAAAGDALARGAVGLMTLESLGLAVAALLLLLWALSFRSQLQRLGALR